jgi:hypothetical protein
MLEFKTQIIKLQNGEDLIANVAFNEYKFILDEPMVFLMDIRGNNSNLLMKHYLPVQLVKKNQMIIKDKDVLSVIEPDVEFIEYYHNTVSKVRELLEERDLVDEMSETDMRNMLQDFSELDIDGITLH